ncbi:MAG TPA: TraR/DksA C4-type zinc finger protein [Gammaproteobacteria bacterium]
MAQRQDIDIDEFETRLRQRRSELWEDIRRELEKHEDQRFSDLIQQADADDRSVADLLVDLNLAEISRDVDELRAIEYALARIEAGSYGICRACGQPIAEERLRAIPETPLCIDCQTRAEESRDTRTPSL